jgi:hypothetical protein
VSRVETRCAYCGEEASTRDHVPTRKLFPTPRPADLITVPSCRACNNDTSPSEEYFVHMILSHVQADTPVARKLREQLFKKKLNSRRGRMIQRMRASMFPAPKLSADGTYQGSASAFEIDRAAPESVTTRILRGLYFATYGERAPIHLETEVVHEPSEETWRDCVRLVSGGATRTIGDEAFQYTIARDTETGAAMCTLVFLGSVRVVISLLRSGE